MDAKRRALHEVPGDFHGICGGRDQVDTNCRCTDLTLTIKLHVYSGIVIGRSWDCRCCDLPVDMERYVATSAIP